jgi:hypothetical protein
VRAKKKLKAVASDARSSGKSELAARIKSRSHHHVEQCKAERRPESKGRNPEGRFMARRDKEECRSLLQTGMSIYGRTPRDPWHQRRARGPTPPSACSSISDAPCEMAMWNDGGRWWVRVDSTEAPAGLRICQREAGGWGLGPEPKIKCS